ncbi:MAG: DNA-directed RNA polymerase subunit L [Candidatus Odinarchaeia archaeon]
MKVNFLKKSKNEIKLEVEGEGHTLFNVLRKILFEDKSVEFAGYHVQHPILGKTIFRIKTDGSKTAKKALIDGLERLKGKTVEFRKKFTEAKKELSV